MHPLFSVFDQFSCLVQNLPGSLAFIQEAETFNERKNDVCRHGYESIHILYTLLNKKEIYFLK